MRLATVRAMALSCLAIVAAVPASGASIEVGSTVPDLALPALGAAETESQRRLSDRDGSTVLVFFRGAW